MNILVVGLGVIGTTYGYLFHEAGHDVEHLVRASSARAAVDSLDIELLDGRTDSKGSNSHGRYTVRRRTRERYDLIVVSVPSGGVAEVMNDLDTNGIRGPVLLCCGFWGERAELNNLMAGREFILGYPVAGGSITGRTLSCCVFDHIMLEREDTARIPNYREIEESSSAHAASDSSSRSTCSNGYGCTWPSMPASVPWRECTGTSTTRRAPRSGSWAPPRCSPAS